MNRKIVLIVSLIAGLVAALLTQIYISTMEAEQRRLRARFLKEYGEKSALCFVADVPSGHQVTAADLTVCKTFAKGNEDVYPTNDMRELIGRYTVGGVRKGVPLRFSYFEGGEQGRDDLWRVNGKDEGLRLISINVTGATSVSGLIRPGDEVDVIGTFDFPSDSGKIRRGDPVTCTILQKVSVRATGTDTSRSLAQGLGVTGGGQRPGYSLVTLAVTPREAEVLAFAEQIKGRLMLTLRPKDDLVTEKDLPNVNFDMIREELEELNKRRIQRQETESRSTRHF